MEGFLDQWFQTDMKEKTKNKAQLAKFCSEIDGLIEKTMDERNPNQVLSRVTTDLKAFSFLVWTTTAASLQSVRNLAFTGKDKLFDVSTTQKLLILPNKTTIQTKMESRLCCQSNDSRCP